jgi:acyl-CoA thioester hydrolase
VSRAGAAHGAGPYPGDAGQPGHRDDPGHRGDAGDPGFRYRHPIEVRYVDTDALGHVNNAVYLSYFEAARAGYYAALTGRPFGSGPDAPRHTFVIAEARIVYRSPALFGEPLACHCRVAWVGRSSFGIEYRVSADASEIGAERVVADGASVQVFYDLEAARVMRAPRELMEAIEAFEARAIPRRVAGEPGRRAR